MLEIDIWPEAKEFLGSLPAKHRRQIASKLFSLAEKPFPARSKQLEGFPPFRRLRSGTYRIVYFVEGNILNVPLINARNDDKIYRRLKKIFQ